jgi:hypothetical protein
MRTGSKLSSSIYKGTLTDLTGTDTSTSTTTSSSTRDSSTSSSQGKPKTYACRLFSSAEAHKKESSQEEQQQGCSWIIPMDDREAT